MSDVMGTQINKFYYTDNAEMHLWAVNKNNEFVVGAGVCPLNANEKDIMFFRYKIDGNDYQSMVQGKNQEVSEAILKGIGTVLEREQSQFLPAAREFALYRHSWKNMALQSDGMENRSDKMRLFLDISKTEKQMESRWKKIEPVIKNAVVNGVSSVLGTDYAMQVKSSIKSASTFRDSLDKYSVRENAMSVVFQKNMEQELQRGIAVEHSGVSKTKSLDK